MEKRNEMIISIYDNLCYVSVKINGDTIPNEYGICLEFDEARPYGIIDFMKRYNIHRLIVCENGDIDIFIQREINGSEDTE